MVAYRDGILAELARHGILPKPDTRPALIRDFLNDLYRLELQRLRDRVRRRELPRPQLATHVVELRRRYLLLSLPVGEWTSPDE